MKTCECGCGEPVPRARDTNRKKGIRKGDPLRFVHGHVARTRVLKQPEDYPPPIRDEETGCLRWQGPHSPEGYGRVGSKRYAHIVLYERVRGPVPEGLELDHVVARGCRFKDCVEITHLEAVSHKENIRRTQKIIDQMAKTHCPHGHEYTEENTRKRRTATGGIKRECRACIRARVRRWKQRQKQL